MAIQHNDSTMRFISQHAQDDVRQLAFMGDKYPDVDLPWALDQIRGRQTARQKLPQWAAVDGIIYPPHLSMEQCSSQATALYKSQVLMSLLERHAPSTDAYRLVDLTGGFGVDFSSLATALVREQRAGNHGQGCLYVERNLDLCEVARHNFDLLGLDQTEVRCATAENVLAELTHADVVFMDPARRDSHGGRTYAIADCTPDVLTLLPMLVQKARFLFLKLSPMLDWHQTVDDLAKAGGHVTEVHIVATKNECKELLVLLSPPGDDAATLQVTSVNDDEIFSCEVDTATLTPLATGLGHHGTAMPEAGYYLFVPNAAVMKAGCFTLLAYRYGVSPIASNSHLFVAPAPVEDFPGRKFRIEGVSTMNKKELRQLIQDVTQANISVRNFPLSADALRRKLKVKEGGPVFLFATTTAGGDHIVMRCVKS